MTGGTLSVFDPSVAGCKPFKVSKGQSFVEPADHARGLQRLSGSL